MVFQEFNSNKIRVWNGSCWDCRLFSVSVRREFKDGYEILRLTEIREFIGR